MLNPFGEVSCEKEMRLYGDKFKDYYFDHVPFNNAATDKSTYLLVGRRGAGKSSLSQYFSFYEGSKNICIEINEPNIYQEVLNKIVSNSSMINVTFGVYNLRKAWELAFWSLIFNFYKDKLPEFESAAFFGSNETRPSIIIKNLFERIFSKIIGDKQNKLSEEIEKYLADDAIRKAIDQFKAYKDKKSLIISVDTLERYDTNDKCLMWSLAALIECAEMFNSNYTIHGINIKIFISAEIYPYLLENVITNNLKVIENAVHLHWKPKDLIRLICWRFKLYLEQNDYKHVGKNIKEIDWNKFEDVHQHIWEPYFNNNLINRNGETERTFPYILRHTQLRPRQLIYFCNAISKHAQFNGEFPIFSGKTIVDSIYETESFLATEVISSYATVYSNAGKIISALNGKPIIFKGKFLDKVAPQSASFWNDPNRPYNKMDFRRLITELGIVGRLIHYDTYTKIVKADFEYALEDTINIQDDDDCIIHPLFLKKLNISNEKKLKIYPFPNNEHFKDMEI